MKNWKEAIISPSSSLRHALEVMDREALQIALVAAEGGRLLGVLTDGDVRRALLRGQLLEVPVSEVMHLNPITAAPNWSAARLLSKLEQHQLLQIPLLDDSGIIVGLKTLHGMLKRPRQDNPVFLMAGGFGTRLRPLTNTCPKPMLKVGERPLLEVIVNSYKSYGFHRFYVSTHFMPEIIRDHFGDGRELGVEITYVHESEPLGTGGALGLLPHDEIDLPLFMMNGDVLTTLNFLALLSHHEEHGGAATMCVREFEHQVPYGVITTDAGKVVEMVEKPIQRYNVNAGIYVLSPSVVHGVKRGTRIDMPTLLEQHISRNDVVNFFHIREYWLDIGRVEDFQRAQVEFSDYFH